MRPTDPLPEGARCYVSGERATKWHTLNDHTRIPVSALGAAIIAAESGRLGWREAMRVRAS